jgi:hypothetical protein
MMSVQHSSTPHQGNGNNGTAATLNRVLWACLSGAVGLVILLVTSWAKDLAARTNNLEVRANIAEQHYVAIQKDIQDLRERMQELKDMFKDQWAGREYVREVREGKR